MEFLILRYQPQPWREVDSVAVALNLSTALSQTWESDLMREHVSAKLGKDLAADIFPDHSALDVPVAEVTPSAGAGARTSSANLFLNIFDSGTCRLSIIDCQALQSQFEISTSPMAGIGSNNWVVSGSHTKSGKPLLANDPHLAHSVPSVWYMIHLKAPGLERNRRQPSRTAARHHWPQ